MLWSASMLTSINMTNGAPGGALVMEGVEYHRVASASFFAILKGWHGHDRQLR